MQTLKSMPRKNGFTLIELMISVAIVGILVAIGYPSYQGYVVGTSRSTAHADLMSLAAALERHKASAFTYKGAAVSGADTGKPDIYHKHSPSAEPFAKRRYDLQISQSSGNAFLIEAKPYASSPQSGDGSVFLYSDGRRAWDKNNNGTISDSEYCWSC